MLTETRILLAAIVLTLLPGCGTMYLVQAARGQLGVMSERRPITKVVADPRTPDALRATLKEVSAARDFATRELGLPDNSSYRTYADVKRRYVVWNVVAAPEFSLRPKQWCFPIAGCVAYRGYFHEQAAERFAASLKQQGFDVTVGGVPAYSTLGKFSDPVLNTMISYGDNELAAIIFHELSHQLIYVAGDSAFNEAFAVTVEEEGLKRWLAARGREKELEVHKRREAQRLEFIQAFRRRRDELARLYATQLPPEEMRKRKHAIFASLATDIELIEKTQGSHTIYSEWARDGLNNAHLASVATYFDCVPGFERILEENDRHLPSFYAAVRKLARLPIKERRAQVCGKQAAALTEDD
jgi:predicted aminopeptidase